MEPDLVARGIRAANPWWQTDRVPDPLISRAPGRPPFRRHAFGEILGAVRASEPGRGLVVLGPRRIGKTVILHQLVQQLLDDGVAPARIALLTLDDVALRGADLGALWSLLETRWPVAPGETRYLLLDEIQHSPQWSGWLKRIADRREPCVFVATGSSATALRHGGQDAGVGRWREMVLYPWSFREHVDFKRAIAGPRPMSFDRIDAMHGALDAGADLDEATRLAEARFAASPDDEADRIENELVDYLVRGGFPEVLTGTDLREAQRHLRQDILDRALGRDVIDQVDLDARTLERMFLRVCTNPGGLWNASEVASDLGISRPTVARYLGVLERAFLLVQLPNLASPVKGQPKVYLVSPALRSALLGLDPFEVRTPEEWGRLVENLVVTTTLATTPEAREIGFWRQGRDECDVVVRYADRAEYIEVKRAGDGAIRGLKAAAASQGLPGPSTVLTQGTSVTRDVAPLGRVHFLQAAIWLYLRRGNAGGTLLGRAP